MALEVSYLNTYGYGIDTANLKANIKLVCDNAMQKSNTAQELINQATNSTNSALLSEYAQNIAKSNIAQLAVDNNLKETLKFLKDETAKTRANQSKKYKFVIKSILTDGDIFDYENFKNLEENEESVDNLEDFNIIINEDTKNIFAA